MFKCSTVSLPEDQNWPPPEPSVESSEFAYEELCRLARNWLLEQLESQEVSNEEQQNREKLRELISSLKTKDMHIYRIQADEKSDTHIPRLKIEFSTIDPMLKEQYAFGHVREESIYLDVHTTSMLINELDEVNRSVLADTLVYVEEMREEYFECLETHCDESDEEELRDPWEQEIPYFLENIELQALHQTIWDGELPTNKKIIR